MILARLLLGLSWRVSGAFSLDTGGDFPGLVGARVAGLVSAGFSSMKVSPGFRFMDKLVEGTSPRVPSRDRTTRGPISWGADAWLTSGVWK